MYQRCLDDASAAKSAEQFCPDCMHDWAFAPGEDEPK